MKRFLLFFALICAISARAQVTPPNISYNGSLTSACTNTNGPCSGAVFVTGATGSNINGSLGSGSALDVPVENYVAATITVSGTYSGLTINFDFSDPTAGNNYFQEVCARTDINLLEISEVVPTNQIRAWQCPVWAAKRFRVRASAISTGSAVIWITLTPAGIDPSLVVAASTVNIAGASDPCLDTSALKTTVAIPAIASATTTQLVALAAGKAVYVCGGEVTTVGNATSAPTVLWETGTSATCGTPTALTGAMSGSNVAGVPFLIPITSEIVTPAGQPFCIVTGGTTTATAGYITIVQQ